MRARGLAARSSALGSNPSLPPGCSLGECSNKKATLDKYCQRQGEMGVGDCGGLRFIPGATRNGVQKRPEWLENLLGSGEE